MDEFESSFIQQEQDPLYLIKEKIHTQNGNYTEAFKAITNSPECLGLNGSMMSQRDLLVKSLHNCQKPKNRDIKDEFVNTVSVLMKQNMINTIKKSNTGSSSHSNKNSSSEGGRNIVGNTHTIDLIRNGVCEKFTPEHVMTIGILWLDEYMYMLRK